ncbi:hypothetical protein [Polaromonas jejuensis]|uniref:Aspartate/glutamate racemase family protein n=1 Tax=Polaromonas jejuensis TaxID=457502 RepID=A0ABW0Q8Y9_9BURK|nr:hypothetical protein [Polaromonas jejuensis]
MSPTSRPFLGILMLDTRFPRPPGDIGNVQTFAPLGIPVRLSKVEGASPSRIVEQADPAMLQPFVDAAIALVEQGAAMISTSCGFLAAYQQQLEAAVPVPVITSSLLQCRALAAPGIVTINAASLHPAILRAAAVPEGTPVQGVRPGCEFHHRILSNDTQMDIAQAERDVVEAALQLVARHPEVKTVVLECTNMPVYRDAVAKSTARPVHDIVTLLNQAWLSHVGGP